VGALPGPGYAILLDEIPEARAELRPGHGLCRAPAEQLLRLGVTAAPAEHPTVAGPACWVPEAAAAAARAAGLEVVPGLDALVAHLEQVLRRRASHFVGVQETQALLDGLEATHPALVRAVVPRTVGIPLLTDVLRRLVDEGVSIRNARLILEALLEWGEHEKDPVALTELVRSSLRRAITFQHTGGEAALAVYLLTPDIEDAVRGAVQRSSTGTYLALDPELGREIVGAIRSAVARPPGGRDAVILTQPDVRRFVRKLIEVQVPHAAVLSYQELEPTVVVKPLARIAIAT
jgi:type III secretion protein V